MYVNHMRVQRTALAELKFKTYFSAAFFIFPRLFFPSIPHALPSTRGVLLLTVELR